ncbi:hypothetical protein B0H14DRAFT_3515453 [Mycena olivaceomarginata]|nr:hypothetical protein B0H14DRAFT_3515453 [Mycena olivaceomarginata]
MESPESPRICFFFIPGDQPLSNGISAFPDPDNALFGPMKPYVPSTMALFEAPSFDMDYSLFGPTLFNLPVTEAAMPLGPRPSLPVFPKADLSLESVESIFADLYASCGTSDPFLEPKPVYAVLEALDKAATLLQDLSLAGAVHDAEESDGDDDLPTMDIDERPTGPLPGWTALQDAAPVYRTCAADKP